MPTRPTGSSNREPSRLVRTSVSPPRPPHLSRLSRTDLPLPLRSRGQPKKSSSSNHAGAIAGGIIGAVVLALVVLTALWYVRRARRRVAMQAAAERDAQYAAHVAIHAASKDDGDDDTPLGDGAATVVRAGTFNLGAVRFTEDSLDHLRAIDRPPAYDRPPPPPPPVPANLPGLLSAAPASSATPSASPPPPPPPPLPLPNRADDEIRELPCS